MNLIPHIENLLTAYRAMPNSLWRNKTISSLTDALAAAHMLEMNKDTTLTQKPALDPSTYATGTIKNADASCVCQLGSINTNCVVHGA